MSVACVSWLPVTSLPPMSTNQMWLAWLTGLSSSHWQLTLLCVHRDVSKMPPESCLFFPSVSVSLISYLPFALTSLRLHFVRLSAPMFLFFFLLSSWIIVNTLTDHSPVISVVYVCFIHGAVCVSLRVSLIQFSCYVSSWRIRYFSHTKPKFISYTDNSFCWYKGW